MICNIKSATTFAILKRKGKAKCCDFVAYIRFPISAFSKNFSTPTFWRDVQAMSVSPSSVSFKSILKMYVIVYWKCTSWLLLYHSYRGGNKINIFLRIYLLPFKKLCMAVSSLKIIIIDGRCSISLRLLCKFYNDWFSGAANGHQNWNIMKLAYVIYHWKGNLMLINFYKSMPLKWIVFKLYAILSIQQHHWYTL